MTNDVAMTQERRASRRAALAADVSAGLSVGEAARKHGLSITHAYNVCAEHGVKPTRALDTQRLLAVLFDLIHTGLNHAELAKKHELSVSRVNKILTAARTVGFRFDHRQDRKGRESKPKRKRRKE